MRSHRLLLSVSLALVLALTVPACARPAPPTREKPGATYAPPVAEPVRDAKLGAMAADQIVVVLADGAQRDSAEKAAEAAGGELAGGIESAGIYQVSIPATTAAGVIAAAKTAGGVSGVAAASPHQVAWLRTMTVKGVPYNLIGDEPQYSGQGRAAFDNIGVERALKIVKASGLPLAETRVGVIDEGLSGKTDEFIYLGLEKRGEKSRSRLRGHGDVVSGIIAADPDNGGAIGIGSVVLGKSLKLTHSKDLDTSISKVASDAASLSVEQAANPTIAKLSDGFYSFQPLVTMTEQIEKKAKVINCSWGVTVTSPEMVAAYRTFFEAMAKEHPDVLFVVAAPNGGPNNPFRLNGSNDIPSGMKLPNVMTVGNVTLNGQIGSVQAEGDGEMSLVAPGGIEGMTTEEVDGKRITHLGDGGTGCTSFATPQVTSAAAILQSLDPELTAADVKRILVETASKEMTTLKGGKWAIPQSMGGRMLSVDAAVLYVVNAKRKKADPNAKDLTMADVEKMYGVDLVATSQDGKEWALVGSIESAAAGKTGLAIALDGEGAIGGTKSQAVAAPGKGQWSVTVPGDPIVVRVTRADTGAGSRVELGADPWVGTWEWKDGNIDFLNVLTITRTNDGYAGKMNGALEFTVEIEGDSIKAVAPFDTMFKKDGTITYTGRMVNGAIVGTSVHDIESGRDEYTWRPKKVK